MPSQPFHEMKVVYDFFTQFSSWLDNEDKDGEKQRRKMVREGEEKDSERREAKDGERREEKDSERRRRKRW